MTTPTEALARAIATQDQLREFIGKHGQEDTATFLLMEADAAISALRAALAAPPAAPPVPAEPVAWRVSLEAEPELGHWFCEEDQTTHGYRSEPLYTAAQPVPATGAQPEPQS